MFYIFKEYIKDVKNLIASHHGGCVGAINLNYSGVSNVIINTCTLNYDTKVYNDNLIIYKSNGRTVKEITDYNGLKVHRINLTK